MQIRKDPLVNNNYYHVYSRSIAQFVIFNSPKDYQRMFNILKLCQYENFNQRISSFLELTVKTQEEYLGKLKQGNKKLVEIVAYCLMPTHIHLILKQIVDGGISKFMSKTLNCYSRYFNIKYSRTGPLWSGRFKSVVILDDDYLLHLTRYIHLNPTSASLVNNPAEWQYSSLLEYIGRAKHQDICVFDSIVSLKPLKYKKFVLNQQDYQRELAQIKSFLIDDYSG